MATNTNPVKRIVRLGASVPTVMAETVSAGNAERSGEMDHYNEDNDEGWQQTYGIVRDMTKRRITACIKVNDCKVRVQLDTGADVNSITQQCVR